MDRGLLGIRRNTPNKMCVIQLVSDDPNRGDISVRKYLAKSTKSTYDVASIGPESEASYYDHQPNAFTLISVCPSPLASPQATRL